MVRSSVCIVGDPRSCPPPEGAAGDGDDDRIAVVICHGMGQQVAFETLELVATGLRDVAPPLGDCPPLVTTRRVRLRPRPHSPQAADILHVPAPPQAPNTRSDPWNEQVLPRAEITLTSTDGHSREVHLYEAYWAPFTEGKVTSSDVITFLLRAAWQGLSHSFTRRPFKRWMFDGWQDFGWQPVLPLAFLLATLVFLAIWLIVGIVLLVASGWTLSGAQGAWPNKELFGQLTRHLLFFEVGTGIAASFLWLSDLYAGSRFRRGTSSQVRAFADALAWVVGWLAFLGVVIAILGSGGAIALSLAGQIHLPTVAAGSFTATSVPADPSLVEQARTAIGSATRWVLEYVPVLVWLIAVSAAWIARWFFVQFLGDVAAYVSSHTVSKFHEVREQIRDATLCVMRAVYAVEKDTTADFKYRKVIVLGHSLGSVVAYDVLNTLINEDLLDDTKRSVVERTKLFLTFGSPLDKTAFVFRNQVSPGSEIRESQAAARQPMIVSYDHRPERWINIFSPADIISGRLSYYDLKLPHPTKRVENVRDSDALTPLLAHIQYWKNPAFRDTLYQAATAPWGALRPPGGTPAAEALPMS